MSISVIFREIKMNISTLSDNELLSIQAEFYNYFETGYDFEEFLKEYLIKMGLDEVEITQRSRDGGVDLTAIRKGVGDFSEIDITNYFIQAKRYALENRIGVREIRELKGTIPFGYKGIFICTSSFTEDAKKEAINDISKPVVLVDGRSLVQSCIDNGIGFIFKPVFSLEKMNKLLNKDKVAKKNLNPIENNYSDYIEKTITSNDVRSRIISIPSSIMKLIPGFMQKIDVVINDKTYSLTINRSRNYLAGVTSILRDYNLLSMDNVITSKNARWSFDTEKNLIKLYIEN